jgi:hypothetical protein
VTTFPSPQGTCQHGKRLKFDSCTDCLLEMAAAKVYDLSSTVEGPPHGDGGKFADPAYRGVEHGN